jgi:hypothetical protein
MSDQHIDTPVRVGTFERFIQAAQTAIRQGAHEHAAITDEGIAAAIHSLRAAEPIARVIALIGNPGR